MSTIKQLILYADMEGASGIFERNRSWLYNGGDDWRKYGRECITSDALAVCRAAVDCGIEDILLYDAHFAGNPEYNIMLEQLPRQVRVFDIPDRCFFWRRIRGQAAQAPLGIITFGQHARNLTPDAYFPHTIQSPPIRGFYLNQLHIAEIGTAVLSFDHTPYLANIGCAASMAEALELSDTVAQIPVKNKATGWEPSPAETYPLIYEGVTAALRHAAQAKEAAVDPPYHFALTLCDGFAYDTNPAFPWKGTLTAQAAEWEAPSVAIGLETFNFVRERIKKLG